MQENSTPLQQHPEYYLYVPPSGPASLLAAFPTEKTDQEGQTETPIIDSEELKNGSLPDDTFLANGAQPMRVFSPSSFMGMVRQVYLSLPIHSCADCTFSRLRPHRKSGS